MTPSIMRTVGRFVVRGKNGSIFVPLSTLSDGVYEIREVLGEMITIRIGDSSMPKERLDALNLEGLYSERGKALMTTKEIKEAVEMEEKAKAKIVRPNKPVKIEIEEPLPEE